MPVAGARHVCRGQHVSADRRALLFHMLCCRVMLQQLAVEMHSCGETGSVLLRPCWAQQSASARLASAAFLYAAQASTAVHRCNFVEIMSMLRVQSSRIRCFFAVFASDPSQERVRRTASTAKTKQSSSIHTHTQERKQPAHSVQNQPVTPLLLLATLPKQTPLASDPAWSRLSRLAVAQVRPSVAWTQQQHTCTPAASQLKQEQSGQDGSGSAAWGAACGPGESLRPQGHGPAAQDGAFVVLTTTLRRAGECGSEVPPCTPLQAQYSAPMCASQDPYCVVTCGRIKLLSSVHKRKPQRDAAPPPTAAVFQTTPSGLVTVSCCACPRPPHLQRHCCCCSAHRGRGEPCLA